MKHAEGSGVGCNSSLRPNLTLTAEESLMLRGLVAGRTEKQVRTSLHVAPIVFLRLLRNVFDKTGSKNMSSLVTWARRQAPGDQRQVER
jgi:FixJ family two-component response regulator